MFGSCSMILSVLVLGVGEGKWWFGWEREG